MSWPKESRHKRGYGSKWVSLRARILRRDGHLCQECKRNGRIIAGRIVDHILCKAHGGTDDESNLEVICDECNRVKVAKESGRPLRNKVRIGTDGWPV